MSLSIGELVGYVDLDTSLADKAMDKLEGLFGSAKGKWSGLLGAAGIGAAGAFAASLVGAMNMEPAKDKLSASLGLTGPESERIGGVAGKLYANAYGENLGDVNDAVAAVVKNIDGMATASSSDLQGVTASVMDVANAFDQDLGMTTAAVGQMMRTGLAKNATEALDILTKGLQGPANKAEDLMETFNEYGTQFRNLGLSGKDAMGLLSQGLKGGARDADIVADSLKEFSLRTQGALEQTNSKGVVSLTSLGAAFDAVGLHGDAMYKAQENLAKGGPAARAAFNSMLEGLKAIKDPALRTRTAVQLFGTQAEDMGKALYSLDLSKAGKELGKVGGAAKAMGKTLNDNASANITSFKRQLQTGFVNMLGGQVLPLVTQVTGALATGLGPALSTVTGFLTDHGTAVGIVAALIASLLIPNLILAGIAATQSGYASVRAWVMQQAAAIRTVAVFVATKVAMVAGWVLMGAQAMLQAARMAAAWLIAMGPVGIVIGIVVGLVALIVTHWDTVKRVTAKVWGAIVSAIKAAWQFIKAAVTAGAQAVKLVVTSYVALWRTILTTVWHAIKAVVQAVWSAIVGVIRTYVGLVVGAINGIGAIVGKVREWFGNAKQAAADKLGDLVAFVRGIPGKVLGALGNLGSLLFNAGKAILQGLINGVESMISTLKSKLSSITKLIPLHKGPMTVDAKLLVPNGAAIMDGLVRGIQSQVPDLKRTLGGITTAVPAMAAAGARGGHTVTRERTVIERRGPLIGQVVQQPGEDSSVLSERLWFATRTRG